jgi:hypothetical protein
MGVPEKAEQGSRSPAQWISYQPQTDSYKQEKAGGKKGVKDSGSRKLQRLYCGCEGEKN